jgi:hypothetical protein
MRVTYVMPDYNDIVGTRPTWKSASARVRAGEVAAPLGALCGEVRLVQERGLERRIADGSFQQSDVFVFPQGFTDHSILINRLKDAGRTVVVDLNDDVFNLPGAIAVNGDLARLAHAVTVPTASLKDRLSDRLCQPIHIVPDVVEGRRGEPRVPGGDGPLSLFWYGWQHKAGVLVEQRDALHRLAARRPIRLTVMTNTDPVRPWLQAFVDGAGGGLDIDLVAWTLSGFAEAMAAADLVLMPWGAVLETAGRSPLRAAQAVWWGRLPVIERPGPDGLPDDCGVLCDTIEHGIDWVLANQKQALARLRRGQQTAAETWAPKVVARRWHAVLEGCHAATVAR